MRPFSTLAVLALPFLGSVFADEPKEQQDRPSSIYSNAHEAFQDLLNALPEESLHAALSSLKDFKNGVFESHHRGVEHVHDKNPALATKLIVAAVQDLKKRQTPSNGTSMIVVPPPLPTSNDEQPPLAESTPPAEQSNPAPPPPANTPADTPAQNTPDSTPTPSPERPVLLPVEQTTTNQRGQTTVRTSSVLSQVTASVAVVVTRTNNQGSTIRTTENRPAVIQTVTDAQGRVTTTTSAGQFAPTPGEVRTETDPGGRTFVTTYTPGGGTVSSIKLVTLTGADGRPSVVTSYTVADPIAPATPARGDPTRTRGEPGLQSTGAAVMNSGPAVGYALAGGALAMLF